eukprot:311996_1
MGVNNLYDIYIAILYPNPIYSNNNHFTHFDVINSLKNLSMYQVQTEYALNIDIDFYYLSPIDISKITNVTNIHPKIWIIPSLRLTENEPEMFLNPLSENKNILIKNMLQNTKNYLELMEPKNNLQNFVNISYICTDYSYYYISKTLNYYSIQWKTIDIEIIDNIFVVYPMNKMNKINKINKINICNHNITQENQKREQGLEKVTIPSISINHALNILIVVAINYKYDIIKQMNDLQYNSNKFNIYWYFNIYNFNDCNSTLYNCKFIKTLNNSYSNIQITTYSLKNKIAFWLNCINPNNKWINDLSIHYIWFTDNDLLLQYFNFNSFIQLSYNLNASISQPIIIAKCSNCQESNFYFLSYNKNTLNRGLIAKTTHFVEQMAPLFTIQTFKIIYPIMFQIFNTNIDLNISDQGYDCIWCGAAKLYTGNDCIIIHYTPIIHMDTRTINKSEEFIKAGQKMFERLQQTFPTFWHYKPTQKEFYIENN